MDEKELYVALQCYYNKGRELFSSFCGFTLANSGFACYVTNQESDTSGAITEAQPIIAEYSITTSKEKTGVNTVFKVY